MPKVKYSDSAKLRGSTQEFCEQHFSTDGKTLFCSCVKFALWLESVFSVQQHCDTVKHTNSLSRHFISQNRH
jgi:hypothetical protein